MAQGKLLYTLKTIIILSRRELMAERFNELSTSVGKMIECCITSITHLGVFVEVGNGISGLIHYSELSIPRVRSFKELGFDIWDKISAKILSVNENFQVSLNYKDQFENMALSLNRNDLIVVQILEQHNHDGYFGYINPNTPILVDIPSDVHCHYGDKILARVKNRKSHHPTNLNVVLHSLLG